MSDMFKHSLITLIPKVKCSQWVADYRPISLCTTFYKVIAKVLANHLRLVLPDIIHEAQSIFIMGYDIADNVALTHDICYNIPHNIFIVKFDQLKAFDSINHDSLIHKLKIKRFSNVFIK